jgi:hypothetical protein
MKRRRSKFELTGCMDPSWRKSRIVARILMREDAGTLTKRDYRLARRFGNDPEVENRLIDQALASICAEKLGR